MTLAVAAVIVTYQSAAEIDNCLRSLDNIAETVVVDNGSADATCQVVGRSKGVRLIANGENRGFAAAANQGLRATRSPLVLFLNPDAAIETDLRGMVKELETPNVGAAAGRLLDTQGSTQVGFNLRRFPTAGDLSREALLLNRLWPGNPWNRLYRCLDLDPARSQDVEQPAGAFLMVRRDVLERVGGWDERFHPLWFEDVDLCRRIRRAGFRIRYLPSCVARHRGGHSLATLSVQQRQVYWYRSLFSYAGKHYSAPARAALRLSVLAGALLRALLALGRGESCRGYGKVMSLALGSHTREARQVQPHVLT